MDSRKLEDLRARYGTGASGQSHHPEFRKVVEQIFAGTDRRPKPYEGVSTLLGAPMRLDALQLPDLGGLDVALIGVPMDLGVTNRAGARLGPARCGAWSASGPITTSSLAPLWRARLPISASGVPQPVQPRESHQDIEACFAKVAAAGVAPLSVGGDHSITPHPEGAGRRPAPGAPPYRCSLRYGRSYEGSKFHHGGPFRQAVLAGVLDPERTMQIGIRGGAEYLWEFSYESG